MLPSERDGPQPVQVLHSDGRWYPGTLERWQRNADGWRGYVWWSEGVGLRHVEWIPADRLRPAEGGDEPFPEWADQRTGVDPHRDPTDDGPGVVDGGG